MRALHVHWMGTGVPVVIAAMCVSGEVHAALSDCRGTPPTWWGPELKCTNPCSVGVPTPSPAQRNMTPVFVAEVDGRAVPGRRMKVLDGTVGGRGAILVQAAGELDPGRWEVRWGEGPAYAHVQVVEADPPLPEELRGRVFQRRPPCNNTKREMNVAEDWYSLNFGDERQEIDTEALSFAFRVSTRELAAEGRAVELDGVTMDMWLWRMGEPEPDFTAPGGRFLERISPDAETGDFQVAYVDGLQHEEAGESFHVAAQLVTPGGYRSEVLHTYLTTKEIVPRGMPLVPGCSGTSVPHTLPSRPSLGALLLMMVWASRASLRGLKRRTRRGFTTSGRGCT